MTRHARQVHNGPKPLSCPYCDYKTADRSNFKKHVELHLNPRQFLCPLCKYAASKKCNLQYHIKSRHSGCSVSMDVSKVKLRVKKPSPDGADQSPDSRSSKLDNSSDVDEDFDVADRDEDEAVDSTPINLSIRRSGRPSIGDVVDKAQRKSTITSESERPAKHKDKLDPEKKVTTRQKKTEKLYENPAENPAVKDNQTETMPAAGPTDAKVKRRVKKLPAEESEGQKDQVDAEKCGQPQKEKTVRQKVAKEEEKLKAEKEKEEQKNDGSGKENKSVNKSKKSGSKKLEKVPEKSEDTQQKAESVEKNRKEKVVKEKAAKRRAVEALDLSTSSSSEPPSKTRRLKASSQAASEDKSSDGSSPVAQKKTRNSSKTTASVPPAEAPAQETCVSPPLADSAQAPPTCGCTETTPSPAEDQAPPIFLKPTSPPSLVLPSQRVRASDPEDDEGIHSSHEGGSDISDSASEGSDDSGLNGNGNGKMANDPETPTDEIPTPTELKSHMCIFCDRTFPLEAEYRRHLNRHLVNVYYMDTSRGHK